MNILDVMIEKRINLDECILTNSHLFELELPLAENIIKTLPLNLLKSSIFYHKNEWFYKFGNDFEKDDDVIYGSFQYLKVFDFIKTVMCAFLFLGEYQRYDYFYRLGDETTGKHRSSLLEMLPIIKAYQINRKINVWSSVPGFADNNTDVDWLIKFSDNLKMLLEVKTRLYDLDYFLVDDSDLNMGIPPETKPDKLFKSITEKYSTIDPGKRLQGCWININMMKGKNEISEYFHNSIDKDKLHFALIHGGNFNSNKVFIIHRDGIDKKDILDRFGLEYTEDLTF